MDPICVINHPKGLYYSELRFIGNNPLLLAGDIEGNVQILRVWGYEDYFNHNLDQKNKLYKGKFK